jgi:hypothetical protein
MSPLIAATDVQPDERPLDAMPMYLVTVGIGAVVTVAAACGRAVTVTVTVGRGCFVVGSLVMTRSAIAVTATVALALVTMKTPSRCLRTTLGCFAPSAATRPLRLDGGVAGRSEDMSED